MRRTAFLTMEMAHRLRQIRAKALLSQAEVAVRMGFSEPHGRAWVARLEAGWIRNPSLGSIALFLRACGARWSEFTDLLEQVPVPEIDMAAIEDSGFPDQEMERVKQATEREVGKFSRKLAFPIGALPVAPDRQRQVAARLRNYRIAVNIIEQAVFEMLRDTKLSPSQYAHYRAVARAALGCFWRALKVRAMREGLLGAFGTAAGQDLAVTRQVLPARILKSLDRRQTLWQEMRLDRVLVARVEEIVILRFSELAGKNPELLP